MKKDKLMQLFKDFEIDKKEANNLTGGIVGGGSSGWGNSTDDPTSGCNTGDTLCTKNGVEEADDCDCDWTDPGPTPLPVAIVAIRPISLSFYIC